MADHHHEEGPKVETVSEKLGDKIDVKDRSSSSSSSDSDDDKKSSSFKAKINRLFGREKPVHKVLGGGKSNFFLSPVCFLFWKFIKFVPFFGNMFC